MEIPPAASNTRKLCSCRLISGLSRETGRGCRTHTCHLDSNIFKDVLHTYIKFNYYKNFDLYKIFTLAASKLKDITTFPSVMKKHVANADESRSLRALRFHNFYFYLFQTIQKLSKISTNFKACLYNLMQSIRAWYASSSAMLGLSKTKSEPCMRSTLYLLSSTNCNICRYRERAPRDIETWVYRFCSSVGLYKFC
ncbi:hypothetical protein PUN28_013062 [Cardiocondyla obscurior]|uniref:Uncharacterized protein n=1 Tax=Cardiocondyla obscurior TaxID=286306 RepID=A0AAW2F6F8_9HYME